ncbi:hypothetical protein WOLCODRAFT_158902 [Wolfiporia cocos MD-104 SS10]|uniref:Uncharacterized protein n=1 Tax=Wolfiporia cocos (strain MD-104) TaxID=742152 RepID=A0A2H3JKL1_WOLCO|nr:hypothetical protein WOLCODRAFT_158902 [Wolfiporia cocos MD-104 SS10]
MPASASTHTQTTEEYIPEEYVQEAFHSYLKSSLTQAKIEGLLPANVLSSAEGDLMITGPALCLYFAALRSTTNPPSVPLPRRSKSHSGRTPTFYLSHDNCPPAFRPFWMVWSQSVPEIQALIPEHQHDLARIICGLPPISSPVNARVAGIAADLRAVAIEISMRRTFQDSYANDLQAALDAGTGGRVKVKASFVPPPTYDAVQSASAPKSSLSHSPSKSSTLSRSPSKSSYLSHSASLSSKISSSSPRISSFNPLPPSSRSPQPTILTPDSPVIEFIRETLYAALADVIERMPSIKRYLRTDPTRAYFAAVAFAILDVATSSVTYPVPDRTFADFYPEDAEKEQEAIIHGVLDKTLRLSQCPPELRPFMAELCAIGKAAHEMEEEDSLATVHALEHDQEPPSPRLERVRDIIEGGVGHMFHSHGTRSRGSSAAHSEGRPTEHRRRTGSTENRAVAFANRINALALGMIQLRAFKERQDTVFKVLAGVGS